VRLDYGPEATTEQIAAAQALLATAPPVGFDWGDAAQALWELARIVAAAKALAANPIADASTLVAGGADLALLLATGLLLNDVKRAINALIAELHAQTAPVTTPDVLVGHPAALVPYVQAGIDQLTGQ
jgi:hypothetical protein